VFALPGLGATAMRRE